MILIATQVKRKSNREKKNEILDFKNKERNINTFKRNDNIFW